MTFLLSLFCTRSVNFFFVMTNLEGGTLILFKSHLYLEMGLAFTEGKELRFSATLFVTVLTGITSRTVPAIAEMIRPDIS